MTRVVLMKANLFKLGGLEKYTLRLAKRFSERGCQVTILTTGQESKDTSKAATLPLDVVFLPCKQFFSFGKLRKFDLECQNWLKKHPHEIVFGTDRHSQQTHYRAGNGVHAEYLSKRREAESSLKTLSFPFNPLHRTILQYEKQTYGNPHTRTIFTNSQMVKNEVLKHYQTDEQRIKVIHNGVEWQEMTQDFDSWESNRASLIDELRLGIRDFQLLFIGNGYRRKGLQHLLKALSCIDHPFHLSVLGKDKEAKEFQKMSRELGLEKKVTFLGQRCDIRKFYQLADAVAIPSLYDPFANVTIEAIAMGVPVITSKYNGASEIITSINGQIVEELLETPSLVNALKKAFECPKKPSCATKIRDSVKHLEFNSQLDKMITQTLNTASHAC